jgi:hypothetical protein
MNKDDDKVMPLVSKEDCLVDIATCKSQVLDEDFNKLVVPSTPRLFEAIA